MVIKRIRLFRVLPRPRPGEVIRALIERLAEPRCVTPLRNIKSGIPNCSLWDHEAAVPAACLVS
jgi:hypothetical protein